MLRYVYKYQHTQKQGLWHIQNDLTLKALNLFTYTCIQSASCQLLQRLTLQPGFQNHPYVTWPQPTFLALVCYSPHEYTVQLAHWLPVEHLPSCPHTGDGLISLSVLGCLLSPCPGRRVGFPDRSYCRLQEGSFLPGLSLSALELSFWLKEGKKTKPHT